MTANEAKEYGLVDEVLLVNQAKGKERLDSVNKELDMQKMRTMKQ